MELTALHPAALPLALAVLLDLALGDPQYRWHPIRLIGRTITGLEHLLRRRGLDGRPGGALLAILSTVIWVVIFSVLIAVAARVADWLALILHVLAVYWMLALRNLIDHVWAVERAARQGDLQGARRETSMFVARDTRGMDLSACRRAGIESLSENLTDGYVSPLFWYLIAGVPGIVAFKVISTLDSMVGNRSDRYVHFGWFSARTDDWLNWVPARLTWLVICAVAFLVPGCSARRGLVVGWEQHALVPGPNSGWSEAAAAGALRMRLVGPIVLDGKLVTDIWLGDAEASPAGGSSADIPKAVALLGGSGVATAMLTIAGLLLYN